MAMENTIDQNGCDMDLRCEQPVLNSILKTSDPQHYSTKGFNNSSLSEDHVNTNMSNQQTSFDPSHKVSPITKNKSAEDKRPRKFICRYCHKAFSLMNVLKVHERIHTGEKPYVCEICDKAFNQSGSLNRHKNTHIKRSCDSRSYSCHYCPRQFLHSSQLQEHEATEHDVTQMTPDIFETGLNDVPTFTSKQNNDSFSSSNGTPISKNNQQFSNQGRNMEQTVSTVPELFGSQNGRTTPSTPFPLPVGLDFFPSHISHINPTNLTVNSAHDPDMKLRATLENILANAQRSNTTFNDGNHLLNLQARSDQNEHNSQRLLEQIGSPFGKIKPTAQKSPDLLATTSRWNDIIPTSASIDALFHNLIQNKNSTTPSLLRSDAVNPEPKGALNNPDALLATLFPNPAAAAALAALGQLLFTAHNGSNNADIWQRPAKDETRVHIPHLPTPTHSNRDTVSHMGTIDQLLNSMTAIKPTIQTNHTKNPILDRLLCNTEQEQCLNLAVPRSLTQLNEYKGIKPTSLSCSRNNLSASGETCITPDYSSIRDTLPTDIRNTSQVRENGHIRMKRSETIRNENAFNEVIDDSVQQHTFEESRNHVVKQDNLFVCKRCGNLQTPDGLSERLHPSADELRDNCTGIRTDQKIHMIADLPEHSRLSKNVNTVDRGTQFSPPSTHDVQADDEKAFIQSQSSCTSSETHSFNEQKLKVVTDKLTDVTHNSTMENTPSLLDHLQALGYLHACGDCQDYFVDPDMLRLHIEWFHNGSSPFACPLCGRSHSSSIDLLKHLSNTHRPGNVQSQPMPTDELVETEEKPLCIVDDESKSQTVETISDMTSGELKNNGLSVMNTSMQDGRTSFEHPDRPPNKRPRADEDIKNDLNAMRRLSQPRCVINPGYEKVSVVDQRNRIFTGIKLIDNVN